MTITLPEKNNLHHAYIIYGDKKESFNFLKDYFLKLGFSFENNPDFFHYVEENISIDLAHELVNINSRKMFSDTRVVVLEFRSILNEAQNALLKLLEEPMHNTYFFLLTETKGFALPTVISRVVEIDSVRGGQQNESSDFVSGTIDKRLKIVEKIVKDKDRARASSIVKEIHKYILEKELDNKKGLLQAVFAAQKFIDKPSSSIKMILEHLAVILK